MDNLSIRYVFDRKRQASDTKQGLLQIEVRIMNTSVKTYISTGIRLYKNQFSNKSGFTCRNHPNANLINGKLKRIFNQVEAFVFSEKCPTIDYVKNWDKENCETYSVIDFIENELKRENPSFAVIEYHRSLIARLKEFGKIKVFSDFTYENIVDFDVHLRKTIKSQPTLYKRHSALHRYIREAINRGFCKFDPYLQFKVKKGKSKEPVFLVESEIEKLKKWNPCDERTGRVKDMFIFQCFTGMAYADMSKFTVDDIFEINGRKVIRSSREKTDESFVSILLPEAKEILEKYNYQLPIISNQKYNDYLKLLASGAEIKKTLTSHVARHTFGTYLINKGIPIESVSRAMGHSNIKMTQHYARMLGKKVIDDMSKLLE
jgi:site-specific recombinase XerD